MRNLTTVSRRILGGSILSVVVVGTLIGVAGNSVFDLLHTSFKLEAWQVTLFSLAALFIVLLPVAALFNRITAQLRRSRQLGLATERGVPPAPGLIVLISQPTPPKQITDLPAVAAINHHLHAAEGQSPPLKHCWLIATAGKGGSEPYAWQIAEIYSNHSSQVKCYVRIIADSDSAQDTFDRMQDIYREAGRDPICLKESDLVADCTGGTKPMSVGMALAVAAQPSHRLSYIPRDPAIPPLLVRIGFFTRDEEE
jgi:CRISPR-associated protein (Cas_Cas02710)